MFPDGFASIFGLSRIAEIEDTLLAYRRLCRTMDVFGRDGHGHMGAALRGEHMVALTIIVQWLHVILGVFWFGSNLYTNIVVIPAVGTLPLTEQQKIGGLLGPASARVITPVSILVVLIGFLRGTVFGSLRSLDAVFGSAYGITWFIALLLGIELILWGALVISPRAEGLNRAKSTEEYARVFGELKVVALLEILGFLAIFTCMILMRFGL